MNWVAFLNGIVKMRGIVSIRIVAKAVLYVFGVAASSAGHMASKLGGVAYRTTVH